MKFAYRTVFLSDTHLGFAGIRAEELSAFLKHLRCERLYLVGDIIDLQALRSRWRWPAVHNQVVRRVLKLAKDGTVVTYVPGNHDDSLRQYAGLDLGGVRLVKRAAHRTADGRVLLVTHGDEYDLVIQHTPLLSVLGTWAYDHLILLNRYVNAIRGWFGLRRWSFSQTVKLKVKSACKFISKFEEAMLVDALRHGMDGVVCGHVHQPELRGALCAEGVGLYANCGDWVERASALVEHDDGRLEILDVEQLLADAGIETRRLCDDTIALSDDAIDESDEALPLTPIAGWLS